MPVFGADVVYVEDIQVEVLVETNEAYWVNFGVWVMCDHGAGLTAAATSFGYGRVSAHLEFVVIQRYT